MGLALVLALALALLLAVGVAFGSGLVSGLDSGPGAAALQNYTEGQFGTPAEDASFHQLDNWLFGLVV